MRSIEDLIGKGSKQISMADVPLQDIAFYATEDADIALQVALKQQPIIPEENLTAPFENIEMPLLPVLITMEGNGVYLDLDFLILIIKIIKEWNVGIIIVKNIDNKNKGPGRDWTYQPTYIKSLIIQSVKSVINKNER